MRRKEFRLDHKFLVIPASVAIMFFGMAKLCETLDARFSTKKQASGEEEDFDVSENIFLDAPDGAKETDHSRFAHTMEISYDSVAGKTRTLVIEKRPGDKIDFDVVGEYLIIYRNGTQIAKYPIGALGDENGAWEETTIQEG